MGDLRHSFDPVFFTQEEKEQLTARLRQAAEQIVHSGVRVFKGLLRGRKCLLFNDGIDAMKGVKCESAQGKHQQQEKDAQQFAPKAHVQQQAAPTGAQFILHGSKDSPGKGGAKCPLPW